MAVYEGRFCSRRRTITFKGATRDGNRLFADSWGGSLALAKLKLGTPRERGGADALAFGRSSCTGDTDSISVG